jgi:hypothetical protein
MQPTFKDTKVRLKRQARIFSQRKASLIRGLLSCHAGSIFFIASTVLDLNKILPE